MMTFLKNAAKEGKELIVMDPRGQALRKHATHMLQFKPGSDVAMLNAIMHVIVEEGRRITARHIRELDKAGVKTLVVPEDYLIGKVLSHNVIDKETGEELVGAACMIGDAIGLAVKRLRDDAATDRVLVLLTDGANTSGEVQPLQAAEFAARDELTVYTVGVGADEMMVQDFFGSRVVNPSADLDEETLKAIAEQTGGRYFRARDAKGLEKIYEILDELEPVESDVEIIRPVDELFFWPMGLAYVLALLAALVNVGSIATIEPGVGAIAFLVFGIRFRSLTARLASVAVLGIGALVVVDAADDEQHAVVVHDGARPWLGGQQGLPGDGVQPGIQRDLFRCARRYSRHEKRAQDDGGRPKQACPRVPPCVHPWSPCFGPLPMLACPDG